MYVGTCGFPKSRRLIYESLDVVELQETFYNFPTRERMAALRGEAPDFHFTVKVFQGITHPPGSPTYRRTRGFRPTERHGGLKPTRENFELWERFVETVSPIMPDFLIFQSPPSLEPSLEIYDFFSTIVGKYRVAWEPRGRTLDVKLLERVRDLGVVIVVDPLKSPPFDSDVYYFRLHGLGKVMYRYRYTVEDFEKLANASLDRVTYVLFNNVYMFEDAVAFKQFLKKFKKF